jgi:leucyl/phenylalanyl-tRNA--protein transferase
MPVFQLTDRIMFPHPDLAEDNGLLAVGGDLSTKRLIAAYRHGIFPWYSEGDPVLWWFTSPRLVLIPDELTIPKRLARKIRQKPFEVSFDRDFGQVIDACATNRTDLGKETWILEEMKMAYIELHKQGYAHSVECWQGSTLAGGLYGLCLDKVFFGESMFTQITDASKIALIALVEHSKQKGIELIDCQMTTRHLLRFGAREVDGQYFQGLLDKLIQSTTPDGTWNNE